MYKQFSPGKELPPFTCRKTQEITLLQTFKLIRFDLKVFSNAGDQEQAIRHEWLSGQMIKCSLASQYVLTPEFIHLLFSFDIFKVMLQQSRSFG